MEARSSVDALDQVNNQKVENLLAISQPSQLDYWQQLIRFAQSSQRDEPPLLDFGMLRRLNLIHIQNELAEIKADVANSKTSSKEQLGQLRSLTHEYGWLSLIVVFDHRTSSNSPCSNGHQRL
jgi:hypothetical protein